MGGGHAAGEGGEEPLLTRYVFKLPMDIYEYGCGYGYLHYWITVYMDTRYGILRR